MPWASRSPTGLRWPATAAANRSRAAATPGAGRPSARHPQEPAPVVSADRDLAYAWMKTRNRAFDNRSPIEVIREFGFAGLLMVLAYPTGPAANEREVLEHCGWPTLTPT